MRQLRLPTLLVFAVLACIAATNATAAAPRTITVNGTGIVTSVPNQASFTFGVTVTAATARVALSQNAQRMSKLIAVIRAQGVAERDIQTAEISLSPNTNDNGTKVINFTATNQVSVITKAIARSGAIIDAAVGAGSNLVDGPSLTISDQQGLRERALKAAIADARGRALAISSAAHTSLGAVLMVTEQSSSPVTFSPSVNLKAAAASTPVQAGTLQTEEDITVVFAIR